MGDLADGVAMAMARNDDGDAGCPGDFILVRFQWVAECQVNVEGMFARCRETHQVHGAVQTCHEGTEKQEIFGPAFGASWVSLGIDFGFMPKEMKLAIADPPNDKI